MSHREANPHTNSFLLCDSSRNMDSMSVVFRKTSVRLGAAQLRTPPSSVLADGQHFYHQLSRLD